MHDNERVLRTHIHKGLPSEIRITSPNKVKKYACDIVSLCTHTVSSCKYDNKMTGTTSFLCHNSLSRLEIELRTHCVTKKSTNVDTLRTRVRKIKTKTEDKLTEWYKYALKNERKDDEFFRLAPWSPQRDHCANQCSIYSALQSDCEYTQNMLRQIEVWCLRVELKITDIVVPSGPLLHHHTICQYHQSSTHPL